MTFQEIKTEFTNRSDDVVDENQIGRWANQSYQQVLGSYENFPFLRGTDTSNTTTASTASYDLPSDFSKLIKLWVANTEYGRVDIEDTKNTSLNNVYSVNAALSQFTLIPTPTQTGQQITLYYEKDITELSDGSDEPIFDSRFHEILVYGALERYHEREKEFNRAAYFRVQFNNELAKLIDYYTNFSKDDVRRMQSNADVLLLDY